MTELEQPRRRMPRGGEQQQPQPEQQQQQQQRKTNEHENASVRPPREPAISSPLSLVLFPVFGTVLLIAGVILFVPVLTPSIFRCHRVFLLITELAHCHLLWTTDWYLAFFRSLLLPVRRLLLPVLLSRRTLAPENLYKEQAPTLNFCIPGHHKSQSLEAKEMADFVESFQKAIHQRYETIERNLLANGIRHVARPLESSLNLSVISPIVWRHCAMRKKSNPLDYLQALTSYWMKLMFLVLLPDKAVLDLYFNDQWGSLAAVQVTVQQGAACLHWSMFFASYRVSKSDVLRSNAGLLAKTRCAYLPAAAATATGGSLLTAAAPSTTATKSRLYQPPTADHSSIPSNSSNGNSNSNNRVRPAFGRRSSHTGSSSTFRNENASFSQSTLSAPHEEVSRSNQRSKQYRRRSSNACSRRGSLQNYQQRQLESSAMSSSRRSVSPPSVVAGSNRRRTFTM